MAQAIAVIVVLTLFVPQARQAMTNLVVIAIVVVGLIVLGVVGYAAFRFTGKSRNANPHWPVVDTDLPYPPGPSQGTATGTSKANSTKPSGVRPTPPRQPSSISELIEGLRSIDWFQFEKIVALAYRKRGFSVARRGGANPDGGIDLVLSKDGERFAVQCKHWKTRDVGVKALREFLGGLTDAGIERGIFITLSGYTDDARSLAAKHRIEIVNEIGLAAMIERTDARFDREALALLCDKRKFCPKCENEMIMRTAQKGPGAGSKFWGCSKYPRCRFTMPAPQTPFAH